MPTYSYRCKQCNEVTEAVQSMNDAPLSACLKCNGHMQRIIMGDVAVQFKGPGFYCTDASSSSNQN